MKNKLLALTLALAMLAALAGCSNNGGTASASPSTQPSQAASAAPSEAADPAPELSGTMKVVATSESYGPLFDQFTADTGVKVEVLSMSSGEVLSKLRAEGGTPSADLWFGGGIDAFMGAKDDGLLEQVTFDAAADLDPTYKDADGYWYSKGITIVGFLVNNRLSRCVRPLDGDRKFFFLICIMQYHCYFLLESKKSDRAGGSPDQIGGKYNK